MINTLNNDSIHQSGNFSHSTTISFDVEGGEEFPTVNPKPNLWYWYTWLQEMRGTSTFTTLETGAESQVTFEGFRYIGSGANVYCGSDSDSPVLASATYGEGIVTISNSYGVTTLTGVLYHERVDINHDSNFGRGSGVFIGESFQLVLPEFVATLWTRTVDGDGLLVFTSPPLLKITSQPNSGTAEIVDGLVHYTPDEDTTGVDSFVYQVITQLGDSDSATVEIGTMDLVIHDLGGRELSEQEEDDPGLFLPVNENNDLAKLLIRELAPAGLKPLDGYFTLAFDPSHIRVWHNKDKTKPSHRDSAEVISASGSHQPTRININDPQDDFVLWVEGKVWGKSPIELTWHGTGGNAVYDSVGVWVVGIDLDVDSDNNGTIEGSDWEEYLESHEFALGKLVYHGKLHPITGNIISQPAIVRLPKNLPLTLQVKFSSEVVEGRSTGTVLLRKYSGTSLGYFSFSGESGKFSLADLEYDPISGEIELWLTPALYTGVKNKTVADAEGKPDNRLRADLVVPDQTLPDISDEVKLLVVREFDFFDRVQNLQHLRSAGASEAVYSPAGDAPTISLDDAKIFTMRYIEYDEMQQILENDPMSSLGNDGEAAEQKGVVKGIIRSYLYNKQTGPFPSKDPSFQAGLYRDYVNGGYALAMRGTELTGWQTAADWLENFKQAFNLSAPAYYNGILLAWAVMKLDAINEHGLRLTGHSMGGGIASAAAVANATPEKFVKAEVFNAAGVRQETLYQYPCTTEMLNAGICTPIITGITPGDVYNSTLVDNYVVWHQPDLFPKSYDVPDILSFLQTYISWIPASPGIKVKLEGLYNLPYDPSQFNKAIAKLKSLEKPDGWIDVPWFGIEVGLIVFKIQSDVISTMIDSHSFDSIYFGLLHDDIASWNAYDSLPPRSR